MQFHPNELFLLYNPSTQTGRQTRAIALTISSHINEVNAIQEKLGPTYWKEVITMLGVTPKDIMDKSHPDYRAKVAGNTYTMDGWLNVLMHNPQLLKAPIAIYNGKALLCRNPTDILKLEMAPRAATKTLPHLKQHA